MRALKVLAFVPLWFLATADASPTPIPTPVNAFITLSISAGGPQSSISVSGNSFNPNQYIILLWDDDPSKGLATVTTDAQGNFANVAVRPYPRAQPGPHRICAHVFPMPCAQFQLQSAPTPTPSATATAATSPSPTVAESPSSTPSLIGIPAGSSNNGLDIMLRPPFVFLPIIGLLALVAAVGYWVFAAMPKPHKSLPAASIVIRSARPTYTPINPDATPPPAPSEPPAEPPWPAANPPEDL